MAELYQDTLTQVKLDKEHDYDNLTRIHERFDYFKDPDNMYNKYKSQFDLDDKKYDSEDDAITASEFSDAESQLLYMRYKIIKNMNKHSGTENEDKMEQLEESMRMAAKNEGNNHLDDAKQHWRKLYADQNAIKVEREKMHYDLERVIASMRLVHQLKRMNIVDILNDKDENIHESFTPFQMLAEQLIDDPSLPQEFRKIMNLVRPENQNMKFVVDDAKSSR